MDIKYLSENDLFSIGICDKTLYYNDYSNKISENIRDVKTIFKENVLKKDYTNQFRLKIIPSNNCNLTCEYCFSKEDRDCKELLEFEKIESTLLHIKDNYDGEIALSFTGGGEPTLNFECIKQIVDLFRGQKNTTFNITTNGIFNESYLPFFVQHNFNFAISMDGVYDIQNFQQVYPLDLKKYELALKNAIKLTESGIKVAILTVLSASTLHKYRGREQDLVKDTLEFFYNKNLKTIMISFDLDIFFNDDTISIDCIIQYCKEVSLWKQIHRDTIVQVKDVYTQNSKYFDNGICVGVSNQKENLTILPNSTFSFCHRVQNKKYCFDSYHITNSNYADRDDVKNLLSRTNQQRKKCKSCIARQTCMGNVCPALLIEEETKNMKNYCENNIKIRENLIEYAIKAIL